MLNIATRTLTVTYRGLGAALPDRRALFTVYCPKCGTPIEEQIPVEHITYGGMSASLLDCPRQGCEMHGGHPIRLPYPPLALIVKTMGAVDGLYVNANHTLKITTTESYVLDLAEPPKPKEE